MIRAAVKGRRRAGERMPSLEAAHADVVPAYGWHRPAATRAALSSMRQTNAAVRRSASVLAYRSSSSTSRRKPVAQARACLIKIHRVCPDSEGAGAERARRLRGRDRGGSWGGAAASFWHEPQSPSTRRFRIASPGLRHGCGCSIGSLSGPDS